VERVEIGAESPTHRGDFSLRLFVYILSGKNVVAKKSKNADGDGNESERHA
jgi:hypothetical protein